METSGSSSVAKVERKVIEKNRRNLMKGLYSQLQSLLPPHATNAKEALSLPDQIDEAVKYIKSLQVKVEKSKEKKEHLVSRKRPYSSSCIQTEIPMPTTTTTSPTIEIHEMGTSMDVILVTGLYTPAMFNSIVCFLYQEGVDIVNASFSIHGNSVFQIVYQKIGKSTTTCGFGGTNLCRRLKQVVCGGVSSNENIEEEEYSLPEQCWEWDLEIEPTSFWGLELA